MMNRVIPGEMRDSLNLERLRPFGLRRILARAAAPEVEDELTAEINYAIFAENVAHVMYGSARDLLQEINARLK